MKLLLVNNSGESVACLNDVEGYDVQNSRDVLALLDLLESLIVAAKKDGRPAGIVPALAHQSAADRQEVANERIR